MQTKTAERSLFSLFQAFAVLVGLMPQAEAVDSVEAKSLSIARSYLDNDELKWEKATVDPVSESVAWVTVAPDQHPYNGGAQFYRVAVDITSGVKTVQRYEVSAPNVDTGISQAPLYADGDLFWVGTVSENGDVTTDPNSPTIGATSTRSTCEWTVGALCGTGGGVTCYGACIALGLVSGPGGLGCAAVCAIIASLGCTAATKKICG